MSDEKRYLAELGQNLDHYIEKVKTLITEGAGDEEILKVLNEAVEQEEALRGDCDIGPRFNVLRTQLHSLLNKCQHIHDDEKLKEEELSTIEEVADKKSARVYVYLYNASGLDLKSWERLFSPRAMGEHSINRPVYTQKEQVETVLRSKPNKSKHGYIEVLVNKEDLLEPFSGTPLKDQYGFPLVRLRQGALRPERIERFVYNNTAYYLNAQGKLIQTDG